MTSKTGKRDKVVFILGPTGAGKSDFAVRLAECVDGEVISCDSMQVYKGMEVISRQPDDSLSARVPHHLVGFLNPGREWNAALFVRRAGGKIRDIIKKRRVPLVVGGTGMYARSFIKGLSPSPPRDERYRGYLRASARRRGTSRLYERLERIDPSYAAKIHPNDLKRIIRALEVYKISGSTLSSQHALTKGLESGYIIESFIIIRSREELYERINRRVEDIFSEGAIEEVKRLRKRLLSSTARSVLGYKEIGSYLDGEISAKEAMELLARNTRRYAKRQMTWFRKEEGERIDLSSLSARKAISICKKKILGRQEHRSAGTQVIR